MSGECVPSVQCSTGPFWNYEMEPALDAIAQAGFTEIELMVSRDPTTQSPETPRRLTSERNLRIASVHGPFLVVTKGIWGGDPLRKIRRGVEMCRELGARVLVVHPPYLWEREYAWGLRDEVSAAREVDVTIAVETMYPRWVGARRLRWHRWATPEELVAHAPAVVLDTSHVCVGRRDVREALQTLRPKLAHVHLSDNAGDGRDGHLELGEGILPIDAFLSDLRRSDYSGGVSLEIAVRRYLERPKELVEALRTNREHVESTLLRGAGLGEGVS